MIDDKTIARARLLRELHEGSVLVLPNAWDAASAALVARAGARAVATTSGGVAWALGCSDGEGLTRDKAVAAVARIAAAVDVPVSADVESGYGESPEDVAATIRAVLEAGAAGINIEDARPADDTLRSPEEQALRSVGEQAPRTVEGQALRSVDEQALRIRAARDAAIPEFVINVRTDVYLREVGDPADRFDEVLSRADGYAKAGADCLFVPGLLDLETLSRLTEASPLPVNVMTGPGGPTIAELTATGVRRISVGTALAQAAYAVAERAAHELLAAGTYTSLEPNVSYPDLNALFA